MGKINICDQTYGAKQIVMVIMVRGLAQGQSDGNGQRFDVEKCEVREGIYNDPICPC